MSVSIDMNAVYSQLVSVLAEELKMDLDTVQSAWTNAWAKMLKIDLNSSAVVRSEKKARRSSASAAAKPKSKRNKSAYNFFCEAEREKIKANTELKLKSNEVMSLVNKNWKELSEDDKKPYVEMAESHKATEANNSSSDSEQEKEEEKEQEKEEEKQQEPAAKKPAKKSPRTVKAKEEKAKKDEPAAEKKSKRAKKTESPKPAEEKKAVAEKAEKKSAKKAESASSSKPVKKSFNFESEEPVSFDDKKWWKTAAMEIGDEEFRYHKATGLIFVLQNDSLVLYGRLIDGVAVLVEELDSTTLEWCRKSGIQTGEEEAETEVEEESIVNDEDVDALFAEDD
jgi:hypothetical protein